MLLWALSHVSCSMKHEGDRQEMVVSRQIQGHGLQGMLEASISTGI